MPATARPMTLSLSLDQFLQLAPDAASLKAARGLAVPAKWPLLGVDDAALWGECRGSGSKPYQTQIDLSGPAFRCTCPSRKFPCKHALALGLLSLQRADAFTRTPQPPWVSEWLSARLQRAERKESASAAPAKTPDSKAAANREARRLTRMREGMDELERWMSDRLRQGLAQLPGQDELWDAIAARMIDAQLPGLAERLRRIRAAVGRGEHWHREVLAGLGQLQVLIEAGRELETLTEPEQLDVRAALGLVPDKGAVLDSGEQLRDQWTVLGVRITDDERLSMRRVWLRGSSSERTALLIDYSHGNARFEPALFSGETLEMTLAFYPSAAPQRALIVDTPRRCPGVPPHPAALDDVLLALSTHLAAAPWRALHAMLLSGVPQPDAQGAWMLRLGAEQALPLILDDDDAWVLIALSGGGALSVFGEWDGALLRPLSAWDTHHLLWSRAL